MSIPEADKWLQELLPKLKEVYSGPIIWKKQSLHLTDYKEWKDDHIMKMRFMPNNNSSLQVSIKANKGHSLTLGIWDSFMELGEYSGDTKKVAIKKSTDIEKNKWHNLRIEIEGTLIRIFLDGKKIIEHNDDSGPMGGYGINASDIRMNQFEITDMNKTPLFVEDFKTLNNWNARSGWALGKGEIVITEKSESRLNHDVNYGGYDILAIDTFRRGQAETSEEYLDFLEHVIDKTNDQAKSDGVPTVILAEFGGSIEEEIGWRDTDPRAKIPITATELAEVTRKVLVMAEEKLDGYIYNGWDIKGQGINSVPEIEAVIKDWYNSH
jgi:hypothetical protein